MYCLGTYGIYMRVCSCVLSRYVGIYMRVCSCVLSRYVGNTCMCAVRVCCLGTLVYT